jgi:hypothetical protein
LRGPFRLTTGDVNENVMRRPGVYTLFERREGPVKYVGRSDTDLQRELRENVGRGNYQFFKFDHCGKREAWVRECHLYHRHRKTTDNVKHPDRPANPMWKCPYEGCEYNKKRS